MQKTYITVLLAVIASVGLLSLVVPEILAASGIVIVLSTLFILIFRRYSSEPDFVTKVFLVGLALRLMFGFIIYGFELRSFFGGDALTFDYRGTVMLDYWLGRLSGESFEVQMVTSRAGPGWGINYLVASIYLVFGRNFLAAQSFVAVIGAATAPLVYACAERIFQNPRVSRISAIAIAVFPSFVIWSSQLMKDGLIIFLLVLSITMVMDLQHRFSYGSVVILILSLAGIISLRFYIFYMVAIAIVGTFLIGINNTTASIVRRVAVLVLIGVALTYLGVIRTATVDFEKYGDLQRVQVSRADQAEAGSGFTEDVDVSTAQGAISAIPIGFLYLMFAPFPWEVSNLRQAITLPESLLWWAMIPLMVWGAWFSVKHKLRAALPILIFTGMLTLVYSVFQSNVGTAYRQRTQVQVFFFMFIAAGWVLYRERKEDRKLLNQVRHRRQVFGVGDELRGLK